MPRRQRDSHDLFDFWDEDVPTHQPSAPSRATPFPKRSTTYRVPAFGPVEETFHTRATPPRIPVLNQAAFDEEEDFPPALSEADFSFIAGPSKPRASHTEGRKTHLAVKRLARLAILPLAFVMLLGVQGFIVSVSGKCDSAQARQQRPCFALNLFTAFADSAINSPAVSPTATSPKLPTIPTDLPNNVRSFVKLALPYAVQAHEDLGWPISMLLAQWGLEHGWTAPDAQGYNWGNTTYAPNCPYQGSHFCYASTPQEGLREYVYTARLSYYDSVRAAVPQGAEATALALGRSPWDAGHYGGADNPGSALLTIMRNFNFYRFDTEK
jgi:hypothetical protein